MPSEQWDRHFLRRCLRVLEMSKDPSTKVGAVIVDPDGVQRSDGLNGFPRRIADTAERLNDRDMKLRLVVHAERNALLNAARIGTSIKGCTLYLAARDANTGTIWGGCPCTACTIEVIQAGIAEVVSYPLRNVPSRWAEDLRFARSLLDEAGVNYREIEP